jgi:hypothetical protein
MAWVTTAGGTMKDLLEKLKGYKLIGLMAVYIILVLLNGNAMSESEAVFGDLTAMDLEKALLAAATIAGKDFFNRTWGKKDGTEVS